MQAYFLAALLLITSVQSVGAQETNPSTPAAPIRIVALQVPWLMDTSRPGPYNKLSEELLYTYTQPIKLEILPLMRAMRHFFEGDADCFLVGDFDEAYFSGSDITRASIIVSNPFNRVAIRAFSRAGEEPIHNIEQLREMRVAVDLGVGGSVRIKKLFPGLTQTVDSVNVAQAHAMLTKGRVDAILMMDYDYELFAVRHTEKDSLIFAPDYKVQHVNDAMMCKASERTRSLIAHVNQRIAQLSKIGSLAEILQRDPGFLAAIEQMGSAK